MQTKQKQKATPYTHVVDISKIHTIHEVIHELEKLNTVLRGSSLENILPFNAVYIIITEQLQKGIDTHHFQDPEIMEQLDLTFVRFYFEALNHYAEKGTLTPLWQPILTPHLPSFMYAFLGANIHITHDLAVAITTIKKSEHLESDFIKADALISKARKKTVQAYIATTTGRPILRTLRFLYEAPLVWLILRWRHGSLDNSIKIRSAQLTITKLEATCRKASHSIITTGRVVAVFGLAKLFRTE